MLVSRMTSLVQCMSTKWVDHVQQKNNTGSHVLWASPILDSLSKFRKLISPSPITNWGITNIKVTNSSAYLIMTRAMSYLRETRCIDPSFSISSTILIFSDIDLCFRRLDMLSSLLEHWRVNAILGKGFIEHLQRRTRGNASASTRERVSHSLPVAAHRTRQCVSQSLHVAVHRAFANSNSKITCCCKSRGKLTLCSTLNK